MRARSREFADISLDSGHGDPIARLAKLARARAGVQDVIAAGPTPSDSKAETDNTGASDNGWYIQIGATPTQDGASALLEKAQASMGDVLGSAQPVTEEVEHRGATLYRARFAGFAGKEEARATCAKLKRKDFACLAVPN